MEKRKLIFIAGSGRSGSTLLGNILAEADGCLAIGETAGFWSAAEDQQICSCGRKYNACVLWGSVLEKYFHVNNPLDFPVPRRGKFLNSYLILPILLGFDKFIDDEYTGILKNYFMGIYKSSGAETLVEESKNLPYFYALKKTAAFDTYVIHIIRDPRAVAYSWQRKKSWQRDSDKKPLDQKYFTIPYYVNASQWFVHQLGWWLSMGIIEKEKYLSIRYEDFVTHPQSHFNKICAQFYLHGDSPFISNDQFKIARENHLINGNPSAPKPGLNSIHEDAEWREKMPLWSKLLVTIICWPMMLVYGYPIFSDHN